MRPDDGDDPFDEFFREIERMMDSMAGGDAVLGSGAGFGTDAHFSVHQDGDRVQVIGDLPGVAKEDLQVKCDGDRVTVSAATATSEFQERVALPVRVDEHSAEATFNNGVLEISFEAIGQSTGIDVD